MVLTPTLDAYIPSIVFEAIPSNRAPTLDKKISLPFKIQLVSQLVSTTIITISFLSYQIINSPPIYMNLAQMQAQPQSLLVCNPFLQVLDAGICKNCGTDIQIASTTVSVCNSQTNIRFFTYKVAHDTTKTDDDLNFYGILTLDNFNINTNLISNFQTWLQNHIVLTPSLSGNGSSVIFDEIDQNRAPT